MLEHKLFWRWLHTLAVAQFVIVTAMTTTFNFKLMNRVFNSGRLSVNTPKNFSPYAQILRRGRHDVQSNLPCIMFICL